MGVDQAAEMAVALVQRIVDAGELGGKVSVGEIVADGFEVQVEGGESDVLAGNGGQALDALQFLIGIIVNRNQESKVRITLEAGGLRRKHREMLEQVALELAEQVVEHQQEAELEPQPARDRRIIHNILKEHPKVTTYSEGEGDNRRVIISPRETEQVETEEQ